jgi:hypothetical protein
MSNPTFNDIELVTQAARTSLGCRQSRATTETMPGVNGLFIQPLGTGGRPIEVTGLLCGVSTAGDLARSEALSAFGACEALADGRTVADFVDSDSTTYANCMVTRVSHGPVRIARRGSGVYLAYLPVTVGLLQLTP